MIIPATYKDYCMLERLIEHINVCLTPKKIYLIIDTRLKSKAINRLQRCGNICILDENNLIANLNYNKMRNLLIQHQCLNKRTGWFLQQFLKLGFAKTSFCDTEYYLSWDADTLPLNKVSFFEEDRVLMALKKEKHKPYFDTILNLFGNQVAFNSQSFIAEHMMFSRKVVCEMIDNIENNNDLIGNDWIGKIINATNPNDLNSFSEFETYGTYCYNYYPKMYKHRNLNTFRKGGYIAGRFVSNKTLNFLSFDLDTISIELGDFPRYFPMNIICWLYKQIILISEKYVKHRYISPPPITLINIPHVVLPFSMEERRVA